MDGAYISIRAQENAPFMLVKLAIGVWRYHYLSSFLLLLCWWISSLCFRSSLLLSSWTCHLWDTLWDWNEKVQQGSLQVIHWCFLIYSLPAFRLCESLKSALVKFYLTLMFWLRKWFDCSCCIDTIKAVYGSTSKELENFNAAIWSST